MMRYSPLRYPGGKGKISSFFSELFVANNLIGGTYIEPYVGGGSIALSIIRKTKRFAIPERAVYFLKTKRTAGGTPPPQNIFDRLTPVFT